MKIKGKKPHKKAETGIMRRIIASLDTGRLGELLVLKGIISEDDLKAALALQKQAGGKLGRILVGQDSLSQRQLCTVLTRQRVLRVLTACIFCIAAMTQVTSKKARADGIREISLQMAFASASAPSIMPVSSFPALFDTYEKRSGNTKPFTKWNDMFAKFDRQMTSGGQASRIAIEWRDSLQGAQNMSLKEMAAKVNNVMNAKPYISDSKNWGSSDYWATPVEFMQRGGDCEDYAIAKYTALRSLGVPDDRMRVAIVQDTLKNIPHAVLIVYTDEGSYILDNQVKTLASADHAGRYRPIFSINRSAWWLHTATSGTQIASR